MFIKIAVCDDDVEIYSQIKRYSEAYSVLTDHELNATYYNSGDKLCESYDDGNKFDIIFMDIEMNGRDGLASAEYIRKNYDREVCVIFLSSYPEYMIESFQVHPHRYVLKPLENNAFRELIDSIIDEYDKKEEQFVVFKTYEGESLVRISDLISVSARKLLDANYPLVVNDGAEEFRAKGTLEKLLEKLENKGFISPSRGCIINMKHVRRITEEKVIMSDKSVVPISRRKAAYIKKIFAKYIVRP